MGWAWNSYADELATAVLLGVPTCLGLAWTFHNWRHRKRTPADVRRDVLLDGLLIASLLPYLYVTLSQGYGNQRTLSLMPFGELSVSFASSQLAFSDVTLLNVGGNAALLLIFGALLPIRSRWSRTLGRVATIAALLSVTVEITQYALAVGRVSSTDDVLLNTAGAVVGALLTRNWWQPRSTDRPAPIRDSWSYRSHDGS
ncbi:VanZ family protein [Streptomyces acidiscabies]|uniref:VanZ family protein n=1 Tax=Streptomyces acidiscabies TaxID=42234 RepID=UPI00067B5F33|nr:VanZ family protein [Streptomyces acidiscabies]